MSGWNQEESSWIADDPTRTKRVDRNVRRRDLAARSVLRPASNVLPSDRERSSIVERVGRQVVMVNRQEARRHDDDDGDVGDTIFKTRPMFDMANVTVVLQTQTTILFDIN